MIENKLYPGDLVKYQNPTNYFPAMDSEDTDMQKWLTDYVGKIGLVLKTDYYSEACIFVHWPDKQPCWCYEEELVFIGEKSV